MFHKSKKSLSYSYNGTKRTCHSVRIITVIKQALSKNVTGTSHSFLDINTVGAATIGTLKSGRLLCISQNFWQAICEVRCKFYKFTSNLGISIRNCQSNGKLWNELGIFAPNFARMWRSNFTITRGCCFEMSAFTVQGKAISSFVRQKIIESWLEWKRPSQIAWTGTETYQTNHC